MKYFRYFKNIYGVVGMACGGVHALMSQNIVGFIHTQSYKKHLSPFLVISIEDSTKYLDVIQIW